MENKNKKSKKFTEASLSVEKLFKDLEKDRANRSLAKKVITDDICYESSPEHPGFIVEVNRKENTKILGIMVNGRFVPKKPV